MTSAQRHNIVAYAEASLQLSARLLRAGNLAGALQTIGQATQAMSRLA